MNPYRYAPPRLPRARRHVLLRLRSAGSRVHALRPFSRRRLSRHFREPVMPIGRYCNGLRAWQRALQDRAHRKRAELFPGIDADYHADPSLKPVAVKACDDYQATPRDPYKACRDAGKEPDERTYALDEMRRYEREAETVDHVFLSISKSNLLARLLYGGETVRTEMCPEHKGKWDGQAMLRGCPHKCGGTGWLCGEPTKEQR